MLGFKLIFLVALQALSVLGLGNNDLLNLPELNEADLQWSTDKIITLNYLLKTLSEVGNVTLIGWQQVWNADGTLKQINTIEMTLLKHMPTEHPEHWELEEELPVVVDVMQSLASENIWLGGSYKHWDRSGDLDELLVVDPNTIEISTKDEILIQWQETVVTDATVAKNLVKTLKQQSLVNVGVLDWNLDGTLNKESSVIIPELMATIVEAENASLPIIKAALTAYSQGVLNQPNSVANYMRDYLKQNIPGYTWIVGQDLDSSPEQPKLYLKMSWDWISIGSFSNSLAVIGVEM